MADLEIKNVTEPDETRPFAGKGNAAVVNVAGHPVLYGTFEPGWRWSEHIKPIVLGKRGKSRNGICLFHISTIIEIKPRCQSSCWVLTLFL